MGKAQNWQATKLTNVTYLPIPAIASHNGELYGTVSTGFGFNMYKLDAGGNSWSAFTPGNITNPRDLLSAGTRLYVTTLNNSVVSMIYYSHDNGATFVTDTVGLPPYFSGVTTMLGMNYYHGKVITNAASYGYWLKDTSETKWKQIDPPTKLNGGADPLTYMNDTLYAYDNTGTNSMYYSANWGSTWTLINKDLPADFACKYLTSDATIGRIYASGIWNTNQNTGVYYSDNRGQNWTSLNFGSLLGKNASNQPQQVTMLYANNGSLYIGLENDKDQSAPNLVSSSNGGITLKADSAGLPNAAAGVCPWKMLTHQNKQFIALNVIDVFSRSAGNSVGENQFLNKLEFYPNPSRNTLSIKTENLNGIVSIMDISGKILFTTSLSETIDISGLSKGTYVATVIFENGTIASEQFVKE